jgi:hypothetical protein
MIHGIISGLKRRIGFNLFAWPGYTRRMKELVCDFDSRPPQPGRPHFGVVVTPWVGTAVPWYSLAIGMLLAAEGSRVTFLFDDLPFGDNTFRYRYIKRCIRSVLNYLTGRHEVIQLSAIGTRTVLDPRARASVQRLARLNAVWQLRGEIMVTGRQQFSDQCEQQLARAYDPIASVVRPGTFDALFVPGGVFGTSGIWTETARAAGIRISSYDTGGYETVMLAADGIACQLQDIPPAFRLLSRNADGEELAFAERSAREEMARRRAGTDTFASQIKGSAAAGREFEGAVLIALNSSWDSAALGLHAVFDDNTQWIVESVRYLLEQTEALVVVRQHPAERLDFARTTDDYGALLRGHFGSHPRLRFIAAAEPVNSYSLLDQVAAVLVYTSTIGIEAAACGRPVITPSNSYYSGLGFVWRADTVVEYHTLLQRAAARELEVSPTMRRDASICYYLTQCCNWVFTPFNPADYVKWSRQSLAELQAEPKVRDILRSLQENVPAAYLNHVERWRAAQGPAATP